MQPLVVTSKSVTVSYKLSSALHLQDAQELLQMVMSLLSEEAGSVKNEFADTRSSDERAGLQCLAEVCNTSSYTSLVLFSPGPLRFWNSAAIAPRFGPLH